jgi:metallo-beta-lactamase family protein
LHIPGLTSEKLRCMNVRVKFLGGAQTVTGSKYLLETDDFRILVDCGLFQGLKPLRQLNWEEFPVDPSTIDAVIITHAHIDHTGYLPKLVREGFAGPVYCTAATADLMELLLLDSAKLQEEEAEWAEEKGYSKHQPPKPLYTTPDAEKALGFLTAVAFDETISITEKIALTYHHAGHILGAASVMLTLHGDTQSKQIYFSGDLGRNDDPILFPPDPRKSCDILFVESTYGDRENEPGNVEEKFAAVINEAVQRKGCVLIPAFAVGRTQSLLFYLEKLISENKIPSIPVYIDSPMAISATRLYKQHASDHKLGELDEEEYSFCRFPQLHYYQAQAASIRLNDIRQNAIIISASGMCTGGRILHHLYNRLKREHDTLLFVGYQAEGTRGRDILEGSETVKIFGVDVPVKCQIREIAGLSAHADLSELTGWLDSNPHKPKMTFLVHGEKQVSETFKQKLERELNWLNVHVPAYMESFELFTGI